MQEAEAVELAKKWMKVEAQERQLIANAQRLLEQKIRLAEKEVRLLEQGEVLERLRAAVKDQSALEERLVREKRDGASYWD